jgi:hypothetical protein
MLAPLNANAQTIEIPVGVQNIIQDVQITANGELQAIAVDGTVIPLDLSLAQGPQPPGRNCPILNLEIGALDLDLLGLIIRTSDICLDISAQRGGGLLGNLLCGIAGQLGRGLSLDEILSGLNAQQRALLTDGLFQIINTALNNLFNEAEVSQDGNSNNVECVGDECTILDLTLGPIELNLLGLVVVLDNCEGGAVELVICGDRDGGLLGSLLCGLLGGNLTLGQLGLPANATFQDVLNSLFELLDDTLPVLPND